MTISSLTAAGTRSAGQSSNIGIEDFLKILTTQLNNQDPLKPMDNEQFVAQIAQFATLEQSRQLNEKIDSLLSVQSATQSVGLLGKTVRIDNGGNTDFTVIQLSLASGQPLLTLKTANGDIISDVTLSQLVVVR
jgi:flagellar basal-body rod modification protein FlgD